MNTIDTSSWQKDGAWSVVPEGIKWAKAGVLVQIGNYATIGNDAQIGNYAKIGISATIGNGAQIGNGATIGNYATIGISATIGNCATIGNGAKIGISARIGNDAQIGNYAKIGNGARVGNNATWVCCVGFADGYYKDMCNVDGVAYIGAGCRWFTLAEALRHWSFGDNPNRANTMCLMQGAIFLAGYHGLKFE